MKTKRKPGELIYGFLKKNAFTQVANSQAYLFIWSDGRIDVNSSEHQLLYKGYSERQALCALKTGATKRKAWGTDNKGRG